MNQITHHSTAPVFAEIDVTSISAFTDRFIKNMKQGKVLTDRGEIYKPSSVRQYKMFYDHLLEFENIHGRQFQFQEINYKFGKEFQIYLTTQDLTLNSISNILKKFKAIMAMAFRENLSFWNGSGLKTPTEVSTEVTLSITEIRKLHQTTLTISERQILEIFTIQCFTGLRYDVLCKFLRNPFLYIKEHEENSYIDIISDKTEEQSVIPLGDTVLKIITDKGGIFKIFSDKHVNRTIKIIAKKAELDKSIVNRQTVSGVKQETFLPKYKKLKSHTARRTFATLLSQTQIPTKQIAAMTGHTTEKQLSLYMRSGKIEFIIPALGNGFFSTEI